jgi:hypothetical protein
MGFRHRPVLMSMLGPFVILSIIGISISLGIRPQLFRSALEGQVCKVVTVDPDYYSHRFLPSNPATPVASYAIDYYQGDGLGMNWTLRILPDGRYSFLWTGCMGVYDRESGYATFEGDHLKLIPVVSSQSKIPRDFVPIRWGGRSYLIPPGDMKQFCESIIGGYEPRNSPHGLFINFYLAGERQQVDGIPDLPEQWTAYLRKNLLTGKVIEVMKDGRVKVDLGSKDGVSVGANLPIRGRGAGYFPRWVLVKSVSEDSCIAEEPPRQGEVPSGFEVAESVSSMLEAPIKVGDVVTARKP